MIIIESKRKKVVTILKIYPDYLLSSDKLERDENGEPLPPVDGLISSEFMAKQGWVLDFGAGIIYNKK